MDNEKFSPSPWKMQPLKKDVFQPYDLILTDAQGYAIACFRPNLGVDEYANARLMKQSPDMYALLQKTMKILTAFSSLPNEDFKNCKGEFDKMAQILNGQIEEIIKNVNDE